MALRNIRTYPDEILRKKSRVVEEITPRIKELIADMAETMYQGEGVGLAAVQVGVLRRIAVVDIGEGLIKLINPVITKTEGEYTDKEACMSVPGEMGYTIRPEKVWVKALNEEGEEFELEAEGFLSKAICHELDHLDGILYIDNLVEAPEGIEEEEEEE